jgi:hypothetical protein
MATVISGAASVMDVEEKEKEKENNTCTVCMESILEKNKCVRPCGHMMCAPCASAWQSRGRIQEFKMQHKKNKENIMVYMTVSNCPMCRRKDEPHDYRSRSKTSMIHEIQFLTRTLYLSGIRVPMSYDSQFTEVDETAVVTTPPAPLLRRLDVFSPYVPPAPVAPIAAPVTALHVPNPVTGFPSQSTGICCRRRMGQCYTTRTKLRCTLCHRFLCRSCRGSGCICIG